MDEDEIEVDEEVAAPESIVSEGDDEELEPEVVPGEDEPRVVDLSSYSRREQELFVSTFPDVHVTGLLAEDAEDEAAPVAEPEADESEQQAAAEDEIPIEEPFIPTPGTVLTGKKVGDTVYGDWILATHEGAPCITDGVNGFRIDESGKPVIDLAWLNSLREEDPSQYMVLHSAYKEALRDHKAETRVIEQQAIESTRQIEERSAKLDEAIQKVAPSLKAHFVKEYEGNPHAEAIADNVVSLYPKLLENFIDQNVDRIAEQEKVSKSQARKMIRADIPAHIHAEIIVDAEKQSLKLALNGKLTATKSAAKAADRVVPPTKTGGRVITSGAPVKTTAPAIPSRFRDKVSGFGWDEETIKAAWANAQTRQ